MLFLEEDDALQVACRLGFHVRDANLLNSAVHRPAATIFGEPAYDSLALAAAAQFESMARNHPMIDGNERMTWVCFRVLLEMHGHRQTFTSNEAFDHIVGVASGAIDLESSATIIAEHIRPS